MKPKNDDNFDNMISVIQDDLVCFNDEYRKFLSSNVDLANSIIKYLNNQNGKQIRPIITFLSARLSGDDVNQKTMNAAILVELIHTASLLHDDVVDFSDTRRGKPTVNNIWKNKTSILMGDFLFSKVLESGVQFGGDEIFSILSVATNKMIESEIKQIEKSKNIDIKQEEYFDIIYGKTASLFSIASELGSISVTEDCEKHEKMRKFGKNFGMAFQIRDDLFDYNGNEKNMGKPKGSDIMEGKVTLPLLYSINQCETLLKERIRDIIGNGEIINANHVEEIIQIVKENGGLDYTFKIAEDFISSAIKELDFFRPSPYKTALKELSEYVIVRER